MIAYALRRNTRKFSLTYLEIETPGHVHRLYENYYKKCYKNHPTKSSNTEQTSHLILLCAGWKTKLRTAGSQTYRELEGEWKTHLTLEKT